MKYIYLLIAAVLITVLSFCTGRKETPTTIKANTNASRCLSEAALFDVDSILLARKELSAAQKDEGTRYFLKAMDLLVNKQKARESIALFRDAIAYFPDSRMYYFLTKAYIDINDEKSAKQSNDVLYRLGYDPYYEICFNDALIAAIGQDSTACINSLSEAVFEGFLNKKRIVNERRFDFVRENPRYVSFIVNTFNDDAKLKALLFKNYLATFPDIQLPYSEPIDSAGNHNYPYINYDYAVFIPTMEDGRFSRDVTNEYFAVGKMKLGDNYAMIYKTYLAIADTLNPVKTFVITYDSLGSVVDEEMLGCFCSPTKGQSFAISDANAIELTGYTYKWKHDPVEKGYAGNEVISVEAGKPQQIQLMENGEIKRTKTTEGDAVVVTQDGSRGG